MGRLLGLVDGSDDGANGLEVGINVGGVLGFNVGSIVSINVGSIVGSKVGVKVGFSEGSSVGFVDGINVGSEYEGNLVGASDDGGSVGFDEGKSERESGEALGADVTG